MSKDKVLELLEEHEEEISEFSVKNEHLATAVKTGFRIWSIWKIVMMIWWGFLACLLLGAGYVIYLIIWHISK